MGSGDQEGVICWSTECSTENSFLSASQFSALKMREKEKKAMSVTTGKHHKF